VEATFVRACNARYAYSLGYGGGLGVTRNNTSARTLVTIAPLNANESKIELEETRVGQPSFAETSWEIARPVPIPINPPRMLRVTASVKNCKRISQCVQEIGRLRLLKMLQIFTKH